jgi:hypothetical protein
VYGGWSVYGKQVASVEMLTSDGSSWQLLPTSMFAADEFFTSVPLTG